MGVLSLVVADPVASARLTNALSQSYRLVFHDSWSDFERRRRSLRPHALIVDVHHPAGPGTLDHLIDVARDGGFGVVICSSFEGREDRLLALGAAGVGGVILPLEAHKRGQVRSEVERAVARAVADEAMAALPATIPASARTALRWAIRHATEGASVTGLAAEIGVSPDSLRRVFQRAGTPSPKRTLMWGRLFFAARELAWSAKPSVERLAIRLGYASRSGLTRMMSRELGAPPRVLRRRDVWGGMCSGQQGSSDDELAQIVHPEIGLVFAEL